MAWHDIYLLASFVCLFVVWGSHDHVLQKVGLVLFFSCVMSNLVHAFMSPPELIAANAVIDLVGMVTVVVVSLRRGHWSFWPIAATYMGMLVLHFAALAAHVPNPHVYYLADNILFCLQLLAVGGGGLVIIGLHLVDYFSRPVSDRGSVHTHRGG